jgi:GNAT superfamily N-acetyltransferase
MDLTGIRIEVDPAPDHDNIQAVRAGLRAFNQSCAPATDFTDFAIFLRDLQNRIVGGLLAETGRGWLHISVLWIDERFRGQDYGSQLMAAAEERARQIGCHAAFLDTFSYQARPFYERLGYEVFGTLKDYPIGHERYFMKKQLVPREP